MSEKRESPIETDREDFRKVGYYLVDVIADFIDSIGNKPVTKGESPDELQALLGSASLPETGAPAEEIIQKAVQLLFNHSLLNGHPRFMGYITSSAAPIGALSDLLSSAVNANVGANILSPMATAIERQTLRWLAEFVGVSPDYGGVLVSGGNMANFTAFLAARTAMTGNTITGEGTENARRLVVYCSAATHAWIEKAVFFFGVGRNGIRWIEQDEDGRMRIDLLERFIQKDLQNGFTPMMVVGNAGDVSTGVVDDLKAIASVCKAYQIWFHVDGAYGLPAAVNPAYKPMFDGVAEADSIAIDPHKWLYTPLEAGCTLVKDPRTLINAFSTHPAYYNFDHPEHQQHNFHEYGFQNSRSFKALKIWTALQQVGREGYIRMISDDIALAELFYRLAADHPELEAVSRNLSITTLRYVPSKERSGKFNSDYLNKLNEELLNTLQAKGEVFLSHAIVRGKYCLRGCIVNFRTAESDIKDIVEIVVREGRQVHKKLMATSGAGREIQS